MEVRGRACRPRKPETTTLYEVVRDNTETLYGALSDKTPGWAVERYRSRLDPGLVRLMNEVRQTLDPNHLMNPGRWEL